MILIRLFQRSRLGFEDPDTTSVETVKSFGDLLFKALNNQPTLGNDIDDEEKSGHEVNSKSLRLQLTYMLDSKLRLSGDFTMEEIASDVPPSVCALILKLVNLKDEGICPFFC